MDFLWGLWNGITAWPLLVIHLFGGLTTHPIYDHVRDGGWYQFGFLLGAGSPFLGMFGRSHQMRRRDRCARTTDDRLPGS